MPWHQEPKKDATSCDKPRGAAHKLRSVDFRMGKPGRAILCQRAMNKIVVRGEPSELKHLSRTRKRHQQRFRKQWRANAEEAKPKVFRDFRGSDLHNDVIVQLNGMGRPSVEGERPVSERRFTLAGIQSTAGHVKPRGNVGGPPSKPKYYLMTDRGTVP